MNDMLFSELNRINLNVLIQDHPYETVPDISACYIHNAVDWTVWCKKNYDTENLARFNGWLVSVFGKCDIENEEDSRFPETTVMSSRDKDFIDELYVEDKLSGPEVEIMNKVNELEINALDMIDSRSNEVNYNPQTNTYFDMTKSAEDLYLLQAFTDIYNNIKIASEKGSDLVKIYAGQFTAEGTVDFDCFNDSIEIMNECRGPKPMSHFTPHRGSWWTFNNGAFQWTNGPKSIHECRFSYGPFNYPDPHHHDKNNKMIDDYVKLSKIPNLVFVFDDKHILKGIVSLPCYDQNIKEITQNFIRTFLMHVRGNASEMSFKNLDGLLESYSKHYAYIPSIRIASKKYKKIELEKPVKAVFKIDAKFNFEENNAKFYKDSTFIYSNMHKLSTMLEKSIWKTYSLDKTFHINPYGPIPKPEHLDDLKPYDAMIDVMNHVNVLQKFTGNIYDATTTFTSVQPWIAILSKDKLYYPRNSEYKAATLLTLSELFKETKNLDKFFEAHEDNNVIVLPEAFCNKETLQYFSDAKYIPFSEL